MRLFLASLLRKCPVKRRLPWESHNSKRHWFNLQQYVTTHASFLADLPSHYNWNIVTGTSKEFQALNLQITEHIEYKPHMMPIQAHLFQSFLHTSKYSNPKPDYNKGMASLDDARKKIKCLQCEEEKTGYLLVAKSNEAHMEYRISSDIAPNLRTTIRKLTSKQTEVSQACIDSVKAFALSRVGPQKYTESIEYFRKALEIQPDNTQWLLRLAMMIGRNAHIKSGNVFCADNEEEIILYMKIIALDKTNAMAYAMLAYNYRLSGNIDQAIDYANRAKELQPNNPHVLQKVGKVLRKCGEYDAALQVFEEACEKSKKSDLYHQVGLVFRDKYKQQIKTHETHKLMKKPSELLHTAVEWYTKALKSSGTNNMALIDRALAYRYLGMRDEAKKDFISVLTVKNIYSREKVIAHSQYGTFLGHVCHDTEEAFQHYKQAIQCAVENCTDPVTKDQTKPKFYGSIQMTVQRAISSYETILDRKIRSPYEIEKSKGFKELGWLHQTLRDYNAARVRYEEYLALDGKRSDFGVLNGLTETLFELGDYDEARNRIQQLKDAKKADLAQVCLIECKCSLEQGKEADQRNQPHKAKHFFREAISAGSLGECQQNQDKLGKAAYARGMEGCQKLADILRKEPDILSLDFRTDCARILNYCELNDASDDHLCKDIKILMDLKNAVYGDLRNEHLTLEQVILENQKSQITREILVDAAQVINLARSMLDQIMISFREEHYPETTGICTFFHIQQENTNQPKTAQQVKDEMLKKLTKTYKWDQFDTRFPDLCDFLTKFQPAYPGNTDNWYIALHQLGNRDKHTDKIRYSKYHIPIILNGCKGVATRFAIPEGQPIYGDHFAPQKKNHLVKYELFDVVEVARKGAIEVERIVKEFRKNMKETG